MIYLFDTCLSTVYIFKSVFLCNSILKALPGKLDIKRHSSSILYISELLLFPRYVVSDNRVIFMLKDGAVAWEVKDFLVQQDRCEEVTIEGKSYPGKASPDYKVSYN